MGALVVDDTGFPKDGDASPCVARQYSGTLGKTGNCQVGVSVHLVNDHASCAAGLAAVLPCRAGTIRRWRTRCRRPGAASRRARAGIPGDVRHTEKWRLALEMLDEMTGAGGWGILDQIAACGEARPVVAADAGYGDDTTLPALSWSNRAGGTWSRSRAPPAPYAGAAQPVTPARGGGPGPPAQPAYPARPANLRQLAIADAGQARQVTWRQGTRTANDNPAASMTSCFLAIRVRPANRDIPRAGDGSLPQCWLLAEWPPEAGEPTGYWLSNLPEDTHVAANSSARPRSAGGSSTTTASSSTGLGLDHFEGRSWTGWHRHVTLAALAQAFCTLLRSDPKAPAPG